MKRCCGGWQCWLSFVALLLVAVGWSVYRPKQTDGVSPERFVEIDRLYGILQGNVEDASGLVLVAEIDHARMAAEAGAVMPPARVILFSSRAVEAALARHGSLPMIEMPLRVLVFEQPESKQARVLANPIEWMRSRHRLAEDPVLDQAYASAMEEALRGIPQASIYEFPDPFMKDAGLVTLDSPFDFETTSARIQQVVSDQSDTVIFGLLDHLGIDPSKTEGQEEASDSGPGQTTARTALFLFGAPGPGGKAMQNAPSLGLDAFCQKLLIWEDKTGKVHVTFNDLLAIARQQEVPISLPLRVINRRIRSTFEDALKPD